MKKLICIFGPTAVGKTNLLLDLFSGKAEIINADSSQVYKHFDIGSAKPSADILSKLKHHFVDILDGHDVFSVGDFVLQTHNLVEDIYCRNLIPVVSGGTAFYIKHLIEGLPSTPKTDPDIRKKISDIGIEKGLSYLLDILKKNDPISYDRLIHTDSYRIHRAVEVFFQTGTPLSSFANFKAVDYDFLLIYLKRDRNIQYQRVEQRLDAMIEQGFFEEVKNLRNMGYNSGCSAMKSIGYRETIFNLENNLPLDLNLIDDIKKNSRHYAKRQETFFNAIYNNHKNSYIFNPDDIDSIRLTISKFLS